MEDNLIYHNGEANTISGWAKKLKISRQALYLRLKKEPIYVALSYTNRWTEENGRRVKTNNKKIFIN